jgi:hypothetical protein
MRMAIEFGANRPVVKRHGHAKTIVLSIQQVSPFYPFKAGVRRPFSFVGLNDLRSLHRFG